MSIDRRMDKQFVVHSISGMLLSKNKEWMADTHNSMDKSQQYNVFRKRTDTKEYILYDYIFIKFQKRQS